MEEFAWTNSDARTSLSTSTSSLEEIAVSKSRKNRNKKSHVPKGNTGKEKGKNYYAKLKTEVFCFDFVLLLKLVFRPARCMSSGSSALTETGVLSLMERANWSKSCRYQRNTEPFAALHSKIIRTASTARDVTLFIKRNQRKNSNRSRLNISRCLTVCKIAVSPLGKHNVNSTWNTKASLKFLSYRSFQCSRVSGSNYSLIARNFYSIMIKYIRLIFKAFFFFW